MQRVVVGGHSSELLPLHSGVPQGSILGPLLFLIYINDLSTELSSDFNQYADDTTLLETVKTPIESVNKINKDLEIISKWAKMWRVTFNPDKTFYLIISLKTTPRYYPPINLDGIQIQETTQFTNLGITLTKNMSWKPHIDKLIDKASKRVTMLKRYQHKLPRPALETIYLTMIRPVLEYGNIIYDNCPNYINNKLEAVQRRAALICTGAYRHTENKRLLNELGWESLYDRRQQHKLIMYYKIASKQVPDYLQNCLPGTVAESTTHLLRNRQNRRPKQYKLSICQKSFFSSTTRLWNKLKEPIQNSLSTMSFKSAIQKFNNKPTTYYQNCIGKCGIWLTRIRLGLSALNAQRFQYNMIDTPYCDNCPNIAENPYHYFLICPTHRNARALLLRKLYHDLRLDITNKKIVLDTIFHGNLTPPNQILLFNAISEYLIQTNRFR
jgi:hypothetical protein